MNPESDSSKPTKKPMARRALDHVTELRRKLFLTPTESAAQARAQLEQVNLAMAEQRQLLRNSILSLVTEKTKTAHNCFEVKLTINRAVMETCVGEQAAIEIAMQVARSIIAKHRALSQTASAKRRQADAETAEAKP